MSVYSLGLFIERILLFRAAKKQSIDHLPVATKTLRVVEQKIAPQDMGTVVSFSASQGERARVVLAWDQCPGHVTTDPALDADLDMVVRSPGPTPSYFSKVPAVDNDEVVEFIPRATGTYTVNLSAPR